MSCPNGAGKSTLLKLMCGEIEPILDDTNDTGMIRRHGHLRIGRYHQHLEDLLDPGIYIYAISTALYMF